MDVIIDILGKTDGRDKLLKLASGLAKIRAYGLGESSPEGKRFVDLGKSVAEGRSLVRFAKWIGNGSRLGTLVPQVVLALPFPPNDPELLGRLVATVGTTACDAAYIVCDNVQYTMSKGFLPLGLVDDRARWVNLGNKFLFFNFVFLVSLDIHQLSVMIRKMMKVQRDLASSSVTPKQLLWQVLALIKNYCDLLVAFQASGYAGNSFKVSNGATGVLGSISASIALSEITKSFLESAAKKRS